MIKVVYVCPMKNSEAKNQNALKISKLDHKEHTLNIINWHKLTDQKIVLQAIIVY